MKYMSIFRCQLQARREEEAQLVYDEVIALSETQVEILLRQRERIPADRQSYKHPCTAEVKWSVWLCEDLFGFRRSHHT